MPRKRLKLWWLIVTLVFLAGFQAGLLAAELVSRWNGDRLRISAPGLNYLAGKPLEDVKNGAPVVYAMELSLAAGARNLVRQRVYERFAFSYDLWEERFAVTRLRDSRNIENLTSAAAQTWCLEQMELSTSGVAADTPVWVKLDIRVEENRGKRGSLPGALDPGLNIARLIDLFSQPRQPRQAGWLLEAGPFLLRDVRRSATLPQGKGSTG